MNKRQVLLTLGLVAASASAGFGLKTVLASGIPTSQPLYYAGTLIEGGTPVTGTRSITVNLWGNAAPTAGEAMLCSTAPGLTPQVIVNGRFRVPMASNCVGAIGTDPNTFVEVVDNGTSLGRVAVGAVPYAVEANHAVSADDAADGGSIAAALASIPPFTGWVSDDAVTLTAAGSALLGAQTSSFWRQAGPGTIEVAIVSSLPTCTATGELLWSLPNGCQVDTSSSSVDYQTLGTGMAISGGVVSTLVVTSQGTANPSEVAVDINGTASGGATCQKLAEPSGPSSLRLTFQTPVTNCGAGADSGP